VIPRLLFAILEHGNLLAEDIENGQGEHGVLLLRISAPPSQGSNQSQNGCHISAKSWSSPSGIHYHRVLDCYSSTVKFAHANVCKSLFINERLSEYFEMSNSRSTKCVSTTHCHANVRVFHRGLTPSA
jgi:hypothetical protein